MQSFSALSIRARFVFAYLLCYVTFPYCIKRLFLSFNQFSSLRSWRLFKNYYPVTSQVAKVRYTGPPPHVKLRANGRNLVGCYMLRPFEHPVACCYMLLGVVASVCTPLPT